LIEPVTQHFFSLARSRITHRHPSYTDLHSLAAAHLADALPQFLVDPPITVVVFIVADLGRYGGRPTEHRPHALDDVAPVVEFARPAASEVFVEAPVAVVIKRVTATVEPLFAGHAVGICPARRARRLLQDPLVTVAITVVVDPIVGDRRRDVHHALRLAVLTHSSMPTK